MLKYDKLIRPIAISIIRNNNSILVYERTDDISKDKFYRLVGGCIEFGELSRDALKREFQEELSLEIINCKLLSTFESIFTFNSVKMHETVFLYTSDFKDTNAYNKKTIEGFGTYFWQTIQVFWRNCNIFDGTSKRQNRAIKIYAKPHFPGG